VITKEEMDKFVASCIEKGWNVRAVTHPKSRQRWYRVPSGRNSYHTVK